MKLLIGTPCYNNQLDSRMVASFLEVLEECKKQNASMNWDRPSSPMLAYNRNVVALTAIQEEYDWLLFWDADISVDDSAFPFKMIECAYKMDVPVVGLPVRLKHPTKYIYNFADKIIDNYVNGILRPDAPISVDVIGTGLMMIKVSLLKELQQPWFHFEDTFEKDRVGFFPEDWYFCEKVKAAGYKIIIDPSIETAHWGSYPFK